MIKKDNAVKVLFVVLCVTCSTTQAAQPQQKFIPLKRELQMQGAKQSPKFFPINQKKPMKLIFAPAGKNAIYKGDKKADPAARIIKKPAKLSEGGNSQLLSIYEPVD